MEEKVEKREQVHEGKKRLEKIEKWERESVYKRVGVTNKEKDKNVLSENCMCGFQILDLISELREI